MTEDEPFEHISGPERGLILLCDHASLRLPAEFGDLGLAPELFATHIAYDIGAAEVTRMFAARFRAPAVLGRWSRLLIDLNRGEDDPTLVMKLSDGSIIPGNRHADIEDRVRRFHRPYHDRVAREIARLGVPALVSVHSFTPVWKGVARPWEVAVLWDRDPRLARPLMDRLRRAGFTVGDNEPYSGALENDSLYRHGTTKGLAHALIEIRQDFVANGAAAREFAGRLAPILEDALAGCGKTTILGFYGVVLRLRWIVISALSLPLSLPRGPAHDGMTSSFGMRTRL